MFHASIRGSAFEALRKERVDPNLRDEKPQMVTLSEKLAALELRKKGMAASQRVRREWARCKVAEEGLLV